MAQLVVGLHGLAAVVLGGGVGAAVGDRQVVGGGGGCLVRRQRDQLFVLLHVAGCRSVAFGEARPCLRVS